MFKRHRHEWEKVSETIVPSFSDRFGVISTLPGMGSWIYDRKLVVTMKCECGKTKKVVTVER